MSRINKLLTPEDSDRCTGRTTAAALLALSRALSNQGTPTIVYDHHDFAGKLAQCRHMERTISGLIAKLGLRHIRVEPHREGGNLTGGVVVCSDIWISLPTTAPKAFVEVPHG